MQFWFGKILLSTTLILLSAGCIVTPEVLTQSEIRFRADLDLKRLLNNQDPISEPIDLFEAMARALKYNLETKVETMKTMLAHQQLNLSHYDLLPQIVANGGYDGRDNFSGARSKSLLSGQTSLEPSTSSDKNLFTADLSLSWDVLDFGLSYVRAQQAADDILIAEEEKRRVAIQVIQQVRAAYWQAVSAIRILGRLKHLQDWVTKALHESQEVHHRHLQAPLAALQYQRDLISTQTEIQRQYQKLATARYDLAMLMNLAPGQPYELVIPSREAPIPNIEQPLHEMEYKALLNRPELRAIDYRKRINAKETKAAILEMLPNLNLQFGPNYSSNSFLFNNHWLAYGAKMSWNLLNVFRQPAKFKTIEAQERILATQSLALTMAIMTQVHVSVAKFTAAKTDLATTKTYFETQQQIGEQVRRAWSTNRISEQILIRERLNNVMAEMRYETALAELETAYSSLLSAIGEDLLPEDLTDESVTELAKALRVRWQNLVQPQEVILREKKHEA